MIYKDEYKIKISYKMRLGTMILVSFLMLVIVSSVVYWNISAPNDKIVEYLISQKKYDVIDGGLVSAFMKVRSASIIGPSAVLMALFGFFTLRGRRVKYGYGYPLLWMFLFVGNGISVFWYVFQKVDVFVILQSGLNFILGICMLVFTIQLMQHRARLREKNARKYK